MRLVYLEDALGDLEWMRHYYERVFPEGNQNAQKQFHLCQSILLENPYIGHPTHRHNVREFSIPKTPFSLIYQVDPGQICVLRVWDERRDRGELY